MWNFFRPHARLASLAILLCLAACGDTPPPPRQFNPGDMVFIGAERLPGQVLEVVPQPPPYKYVVRYLPPPPSTSRDFRKDIFEEIELHLDKRGAKPPQEQPKTEPPQTEPPQEQPK
ncbi:MAG TPA: hypothetical protein VFZ44_09895 [Pyrinomonadaceae bacterium]